MNIFYKKLTLDFTRHCKNIKTNFDKVKCDRQKDFAKYYKTENTLNILAIDTSSDSMSIALKYDGEIKAELNLNCGLVHSNTLMPSIKYLFEVANLDKKDLEAVAVCVGPGSFTGIRIGVATANAMALALGIPAVCVSSLEALAMNYRHTNAIIIPTVDAQRKNVYTAVYEANNGKLRTVKDEYICSIQELKDYADTIDKKVIISGCIIDRTSPDSNYDNYIKASNVALIAENLIMSENISDKDKKIAVPKYMQKSQAEEVYERKLKENA